MTLTEEHSVRFEYQFSSGLGAYEHSRYINNVFLSIKLQNEHGDDIATIGQVDFLQVLIDNTWDAPFPLYDILDIHSEYLARHIFNIFDVEQREFTEALQEHYSHDLFGSNVGLIQKVSILPKFRGYQIGAKAIKDLLFHYTSTCALFALQPYPLQFEPKESVKENANLELDTFEQDEKKAFKQLSNYYKSIGFHTVKGFKDLLFFNPALKNEKLDQLDLDELPFAKTKNKAS